MEQNDISSRIVFADRGKVNVEKGVEFAPKFDQNGLIPALAMDHITHEPLMLAYMNAESLRMTMELGEAVYYSRSRQEIWHKGATSGHVQKVKQILVDCDQDALIVLVDQCGAGACHTGHHSCFYRSVPFGDELKAQPQGGAVTLREADGVSHDGCRFRDAGPVPMLFGSASSSRNRPHGGSAGDCPDAGSQGKGSEE